MSPEMTVIEVRLFVKRQLQINQRLISFSTFKLHFFICSIVAAVAAKVRPSQSVSIEEDIIDEEDEFDGVNES